MNIQVVHTRKPDGTVGHHARIRAENNEIVWVTESYTQPAGAYHAINLLAELVPAATTAAGVGAGGFVVQEVWEGDDEAAGEVEGS